MTVLQAIILGIVQGLTEFLPVSSSGHLVIFQHIFNIQEAPLTFDVLVHMGTLVAVFIAFWEDILMILKRPFSKLTYLIVVGCIPAALLGYFLQPVFEQAFESLLVVGVGLFFTGFILKISENLSRKSIGLKEEYETSYWNALFVGLLQGLAIIPGISRSGSTIAGGLLAGMDRNFAARFSFLLSIPVILGAGIIKIKDLFVIGVASENIISYIVGPLAAAVFGYMAIKLVLRMVKQGRLAVFSYYCWTVGSLTLLAYFL